MSNIKASLILFWRVCVLLAVFMCPDVLSAEQHASRLSLERPGNREFVRDLANLIDPADEETIRELCNLLLTERATPILVVTIESMRRHGGGGLSIETFASLLFNQWGIGHARLEGREWNTGILLLVSKADCKARIELGAGWGRTKDSACRTIMDDHIISQFKRGDFGQGIVDGVVALDRMARDKELPGPRRQLSSFGIAGVTSVVVAIATLMSLMKSGSYGWAYATWAAFFSLPGMLLYWSGKPSTIRAGRNDPCPCGSGAKFKKCCYRLRRKPSRFGNRVSYDPPAYRKRSDTDGVWRRQNWIRPYTGGWTSGSSHSGRFSGGSFGGGASGGGGATGSW